MTGEQRYDLLIYNSQLLVIYVYKQMTSLCSFRVLLFLFLFVVIVDIIVGRNTVVSAGVVVFKFSVVALSHFSLRYNHIFVTVVCIAFVD